MKELYALMQFVAENKPTEATLLVVNLSGDEAKAVLTMMVMGMLTPEGRAGMSAGANVSGSTLIDVAEDMKRLASES